MSITHTQNLHIIYLRLCSELKSKIHLVFNFL